MRKSMFGSGGSCRKFRGTLLKVIFIIRIGPAFGAAYVSIPANGTNDHASDSLTRDLAQPRCVTESCKSMATQILSSINHTADPCEDFFQYACGGWKMSHPIPDNQSAIDNFWLLTEKMKIVKQNLLDMPQKDLSFTAEAKVKGVYQQCKRTDDIEKLRSKPLLQLFDEVLGGWPVLKPQWKADGFDLFSILAKLRRFQDEPFLSITVAQNLRIPERNIINIDEPTFSSTRDVYLSDAGPAYVESYHQFIWNSTSLMLRDAGDKRSVSEVAQDLRDILDLERNLTVAGLAGVQARDSLRYINYITLGDIQKTHNLQSDFLRNLTNFTSAMFSLVQLDSSINDSTLVVLAGPKYLERLDSKLLQLQQLPDKGNRLLANFIGWRLYSGYALRLSREYRDVTEEHQQRVFGQKTRQEKSTGEVCMSDVALQLPLGLSALYIRDLVKLDAKVKATEMTQDIHDGIKELIEKAGWMDLHTTASALEKLSKMLNIVGYAKEYQTDLSLISKNYDDIKIRPTYFETLHSLDERNSFKTLRKIIKNNTRIDPIDNPDDVSVVNAYNSLEKNYIAEAAGILQPPFFDADSPAFVNYGGIGFIIGHEMTHGFDDQGALYGNEGKLESWWSNETRSAFRQRKQLLVEQYNNYSFPDIGRVQGDLTLGENIADNGGLKAAYLGYSKFLERNRGKVPVLDGLQNFTADQLFFLSAGQVWCSNDRPEALRMQMLTDVHSPTKFRTNGPLSNTPEFATAYGCPVDSPMNPAIKRSVW